VLTRNEHRHYINVGGAVVAVVKTLDGASKGTLPTDASQVQFWHRDALGSIVAVSDKNGAVQERMSFDPWGRRQRDTGGVDASVNPSRGDRGYTGHEHLDELALIHMNGRLYDPQLARMLSPDPVVGDAADPQTYNRYAYVYNQPLRLTDPTGHCPICAVAFIAGTAMVDNGNKYWSLVGSILQFWGGSSFLGAGVTSGPLAALGGKGLGWVSAAASFTAAATAGVINGDGLGQSLLSGAFAAAFTTVGEAFKAKLPELVISHATLGCARSALAGGDCGPAALASGLSKDRKSVV
jgi:RHS repeat-associated protein